MCYFCCLGFTSGSVFWNDESGNSMNKVNGSMPDGYFLDSFSCASGDCQGTDETPPIFLLWNTWIWYCCRSDAPHNSVIELPRQKPFYLLRYKDTCQQVNQMSVREEWFNWDCEHTHNENSEHGTHPDIYKNGSKLKVYYCYYS